MLTLADLRALREKVAGDEIGRLFWAMGDPQAPVIREALLVLLDELIERRERDQ